MSGTARRHPPEAGRHRLHDRREERRCRRHLVREHLSRLPRRQSQPPLFLLVRAEPRLAASLLARSRCCCDYFQRMADKYGLRAAHPLRDAGRARRRSTRSAHWNVRVARQGRQGGDAERQRGDHRGRPAQPARACPTSRASARFKGPAFHSARWRHDVDLTGKRVAVIGTGASAFQFVPGDRAEGGDS